MTKKDKCDFFCDFQTPCTSAKKEEANFSHFAIMLILTWKMKNFQFLHPSASEKPERKSYLLRRVFLASGLIYGISRSLCELKRRTCGQKVVEAPYSHCKATQYCQRGLKCPQTQKKMICGSDGQFYPSECEMHRENCG